MKNGTRIEILIAVNNDARWHNGMIIEPSAKHPKCWNVRLDDGRRFDGCHPDSMRKLPAVPVAAFR